MKKLKEINWGFIGCGSVCERKSGPAFNMIPGSRIAAVMRRTGSKAEDYARRHGITKWYTDAQALLDDQEINAIYVATKPDTHAEYTIRAAKTGRPVYVEKPMARNDKECADMIAACKNAGVPLFVAYYRRCLPYFLKVKELVECGSIGEILSVHIELFFSRIKKDFDKGADQSGWQNRLIESGGGNFYDLASHQFDFLDFLFGAISDARGRTVPLKKHYPVEDLICADYTFKSGIIGSSMHCYVASKNTNKDRIHIYGTNGEISFSVFKPDPIELRIGDISESFDIPWPDPIQKPIIDSIVAELSGIGTCPSTGESAARTNAVLEKIIRSTQTQ